MADENNNTKSGAQRVTVGRIVLVKSPAFYGECPAIVTAVYANHPEMPESINCRVFTNESGECPLLIAVQPQEDSIEMWGWRWPPRESNTPAVDNLDALDRVLADANKAT